MITTFLRCVSKENGEYIHLPYDGGAMSQPHKSMAAFDVLQNVFITKIKKENEARAAKIKSRSKN